MYKWRLGSEDEKQWVVKKEPTISVDSLTIINLPILDEHLRLFVPALFSEIKVVDNEIIIKVPYQVVPRIVEHLRDNYCINANFKVIGV